MTKERLPTKMRRPFLRVGVAIAAAGLALPACGTGGTSTESTVPGKSTTTIPDESTTTIPGTTTELPTTTLEPQPTDVVEHRDGYDVLRNDGFLYEVPSAPEFGGFELHIRYGQNIYGFAEVENGEELTQEVLFRNLLWTFANQHPEFIKVDGQPDVDAYRSYLSGNDWIDTVYLPKNIAEESGVYYPPVVPSDPVRLDFRKPFVIGNSDMRDIDGFSAENPNFYQPTQADDVFMVFGINNDSQLYFGNYNLNLVTEKNTPLRMVPPFEDFPIANNLGNILSISSRITYPAETPRHNWVEPIVNFYGPAYKTPLESPPPYAVMDIFDFIGINAAKTKLTNELFKLITK